MTGSVLDILIYVFDRYMLDEVPEVPEREDLARQLEGAGFTHHNVERALDWLADLACVRDALPLEGNGAAVRIFSDGELSRLSTEWAGCSMYSRQKDPVIDRVLLRGRARFVKPRLFSRQDGIRPLVRAIREGYLFYYLPDQDFGPRDSVFVPFFGVPAATITALGRLARLANATVVPAVTRQLPGAAGYCTTLHPPWQDFPSGDDERDARRMNEFIEQRVLEMPEQYWWVHRRFKTRPPGEPSPY